MRPLAVPRQGGLYPRELIERSFRENGFVLLKGFLGSELRRPLRAALERRLEVARSREGILKFPEFPYAEFLLGDVLAIRGLEAFNYIFFCNELLDIVRKILGSSELVYWGDSSVQVGEAARGFHKDNVARSDPFHDDWNGEYGLVRAGFYFQDHLHHSGGLKVRIGSHNEPTHLAGRMLDVPTEFGDLLIWSMRLTHSGNNRKLKFPNRVTLHPRLEAVLPRMFTAPEQLRRAAAFCAFGRPGSQLDTYIRNMNVRAADYRKYFERARNAGDAREFLGGVGVQFVQPNEYYGVLDYAGA